MKEISFEKAFDALEKAVDELEGGGLDLDTALKKYEEGIKMARYCQAKLDKAKAKIEILMKEKDGKFDLKPFKEN